MAVTVDKQTRRPSSHQGLLSFIPAAKPTGRNRPALANQIDRKVARRSWSYLIREIVLAATAIGFTGDAISIAVHLRAITGLPAVDWCGAYGAGFVAAAEIDARWLRTCEGLARAIGGRRRSRPRRGMGGAIVARQLKLRIPESDAPTAGTRLVGDIEGREMWQGNGEPGVGHCR